MMHDPLEEQPGPLPHPRFPQASRLRDSAARRHHKPRADHAGQRLAVLSVLRHFPSEHTRQFPCCRLNHDELPVENAAKRVVGCQRQIPGRLKERIDCGRHRTTAAVPQDDNKPQAAPQMIDCVSQAAEHVVAETVAGNPDDEQVVRPR